jgi:hypothetical protein
MTPVAVLLSALFVTGRLASQNELAAMKSGGSATNSGAAYVFIRQGTNWSQQAYLKASNTGGATATQGGDYFGVSVCISGDAAIIGAFLKTAPLVASTGAS